MKELFQQLIEANTAKEVTDFLEELIDFHDVEWLPVGDRQDNIATINIGTDPAAGLTERITNAIDAVLDLEWIRKGEPVNINSPRLAASEWFGIPDGKLRNIDDVRDKTIQAVSKRIKVTLRDSERENYPTVEVRDNGIGIKGEHFSKTILALHGGNKIKKLHLMGAYGQGGSTALSYNNFTIIISKPSLREASESPIVAFTVVRINSGILGQDKDEWFEYCVDKRSKKPFSIEIPDAEFEPGTLVRHIGMDLGKYTAAMTQPTGSLWYLAHHYLFDPIIPFTVSDERSKKTKQESAVNRGVYGNNRRLSKGGGDERSLTQYQREIPLTFRDGKVTIYYWVLTIEGDKPQDRIKNYTLTSQPIIITFNGQKQGYLPNTIIKNELKLPFLEKFLVVQIECDSLDNQSKRHLFSTTRESLRETAILDELRQLTIDTLSEDDNLRILDRERKERYLKKDETEVLDKLRKRLANRINAFLKVAGGNKSVTATETKETVNRKKQSPIPVNDPPTFLEITTPDNKEVRIGKTFGVKFKTDAHPNYFINPDAFLAFIDPHAFGSFTGTATVIEGHGIAYFRVRENIDEGTEAKITLELRPPRLKTITDSLDVVAIKPPEESNAKKEGNTSTPNIQIHPVTENDPYYKDHEWTSSSVADVEMSEESVDIFINDSNKHIMKLIERAQQYNTKAVDSIKNRYREHIGFCAFMIHNNKIEEHLSDEDGKSISSSQIETVKRADLENACETICGMIGDFFEYIRTEVQED